LTLLVLSGEFSPGTIDFAFDLTGSSTDADGIFVIGNPESGISFDAGDLQASFDLFGSPTTFLIVENFTGSVGDDLDTNDDGTFDVSPFGNIINGLSLVDGDANPDVNYGGIVVGPDGSFAPAHGFRIDNGSGEFTIGDFGDLFNDTPGELNREPTVPVADDVSTLTGDADHLTTLTYNIRSVDDFATGTLFDNAAGIADHIVNFSNSPDIIALQEVSNARSDEVLQGIVDAITAAGGPAYEIVFVPSDIVGNVGTTTITNAFLYRPDRVDFVEGSAALLPEVQVGNSFPRFPMISEFVFNGETVTLINAHLSSGSAGSDPDVNGDAAERLEQAEELSIILDSILDENQDANVIVLGDYNDTQFGEPTIELVDDELTNLFVEADPSELTTNRFGNPIDHIAVSDSLAASAEFDYIRVNADFGAVVSDHDPVLARFLFRQDAVETITSPAGFARSRADASANAVQVSLTNSGELQNYFDISRLRGAEIQIIQDGEDDFQIIIGFRGRFFTAFDFDDVGSLGDNADANLYEFLSSLEGSGLPAGAAFTVGRVADFNSDAPLDFDALEFSELHIALDREIVDASGNRAFDTALDRVAFLTGGRVAVAAAGDDDILLGENNRDSYVESLIGGDGNDLLIGGRGTDILDGGDGSDNYLYREGDGDDTIIESGEGFDTLTFGEGISASDITITQDIDDVNTYIILIDDGSSDGSTIRLTSTDDDFGGIDQIVFADGTVLNDDDGFGNLLTF
jgi:endonuclease/exonuclease/phosphatase family metal-dependent hydrolase